MSRVLLMGHPVAHSLSPAMHNAAFAALGMTHRYEAQDIDHDSVPRVVEALRGEEWLGANVTIPYKETVLRLVDELSAEARGIGAVNTIIRRGSRLIGDNTDRYGFAKAIDPGPENARVLVLGAGGAARAVASELAPRNEVIIASRRLEQAARLAAEVTKGARRPPRAIAWSEVAGVGPIGAIVNATPLGLHGEDVLAGLGLDDLPALVVDLVPTATETPLVKRARVASPRQHSRVVDGLEMLLYQAARSFTLWTGRIAPLKVMAGALPRAVSLPMRGE
jgi:shikimate dehydrogenase